MNIDKNYFKVKVYVLGILPMNIRELTQLYCPRCEDTFSFKDLDLDPT